MNNYSVDLTLEQRCNLIKLAEYLEAAPKDAKGNSLMEWVWYTPKDAIRKGPLAGVPARPGETVGEYCNRVFGFWTEKSAEGYWCFCHDWLYRNNTVVGVAKRIRYMLEYGIPENHEAELSG